MQKHITLKPRISAYLLVSKGEAVRLTPNPVFWTVLLSNAGKNQQNAYSFTLHLTRTLLCVGCSDYRTMATVMI